MTMHCQLYLMPTLTIYILQFFSDHKELRIEEAILIKEKSPIINIKYNEMSNVINLYK